MATSLSPTGTLTYNGFNLNNAHTEIVSFTQRPVRDKADRTDVYFVYTLTVATVIQSTPSTTIDTQIDSARSLLGRSGGALTASNLGLGTFSINTGNVRDVKWGPKTDLQIFPHTPYFARLVWTVQVAIPECSSGTPAYTGKVIAYNYEPTYFIDENGYTTVTHTGYIEIPISRRAVGDNSLPDHVDQYRGDIPINRIAGFARISQSFHCSADGRTLSFTIVDKELSTVPPKGMVRWKLSHELVPTGGSIFLYEVRLTLRLHPAKGYTFADAFRVYEQMYEFYTPPPGRSRPTHFSINTEKGDDLPSITFHYSYAYYPAAQDKDKKGAPSGFSVAKLFDETKIFHMPPPNSADEWQKALSTTTSERGRADLKLLPRDDKIVDACNTLDADVTTAAALEKAKAVAAKKFDFQQAPKGDASFGECVVHPRIVTSSSPAYHVSTVPQGSGGVKTMYPNNELWHLVIYYHMERYSLVPVAPVALNLSGNELELVHMRPHATTKETNDAGLNRYTLTGEDRYRIKDWNSKLGDSLPDSNTWQVTFKANGAFPEAWGDPQKPLTLDVNVRKLS